MVHLVDTHCHLDFEWFDSDRLDVVARAIDRGVIRILNPGIDLASSQRAVALADQFECVYAAVGVHPNSAATWSDDTEPKLVELAQHPKVVAVGEIGLDYYRDHASPAHQRRVLDFQLNLAKELELPVVLHNRDASDDLLRMLAGWQADLVESSSRIGGRPGVLHSFSATGEAAQKAQDLGFFIGITGPVTYKNAELLREVVAGLRADRILIETDAPFLSPHPRRGKRNEPAHVYWVAEKIAEIRAQTLEAFAGQACVNAERLFGW